MTMKSTEGSSMLWQVCVLFFCVVVPAVAVAQERPELSEVMKLRLIKNDLTRATRTMTVYDRNDSGTLDEAERKLLTWKSGSMDFDVNRDGMLTNVEVALREAFLRSRDGITEKDIEASVFFLNRNDKNRNGRIDPHEFEKANWPSSADEFDANNDGVVTARELQIQLAFERTLHREMGIEEVDQSRAMMIMSRFDSDRDKHISLEESEIAPIPLPLSKFDEDNDGKLRMLELATMYASHRINLGLSHFDVKKVNGIFARHDPDGNGEIEIGLSKKQIESEFGVGAKIDIGKGNSRAQQLIHFDADRDGIVTITEVESHLAKVRARLGYAKAEFQKARQVITRYDSNRSNHIETNELEPAVKAKQLPPSIFKTADRNGDGKIALEELARHFSINKGVAGEK